MKLLKTRFLGRLAKDESGQSLAVLIISMVAMTALAASGVETGHVYYAYRLLQTSTNAAALAAAQAMPDIGTQSAATAGTAWGNLINYSSETGKLNANGMLQNDSISANFYCSSTVTGSLNVSCQSPPTGEGSCSNGATGCNAIAITQTAKVNLWFGGLVGIRTFNLSAQASAAMRGGTDIPYNIAVILDTTASMNNAASSGDGCGTNATQIQCAVSGLKVLMQTMDPCPLNTTCASSSTYVDDITLFAFPAIQEYSASNPTKNANDDTVCTTTNPPTVPYGFEDVTAADTAYSLALPWNTTTANATYGSSDAGFYQIVNFNYAYKTNDQTTTLASGNPLAVTVGTGCNGLQAPGGQGTYYAQVIYAAQAALAVQQAANAGSQNILIIMSDGDSNACNNQAYSTGGGNVCTSGHANEITAWNCPTIGASGCHGTPLNGTGTSTTFPASTDSLSRAIGYNSATYPSEIGQCGQAVQAAQAATAAGTTVYAVAMGSETSGGCTTDQHITISNLTNGAVTWPGGSYSKQPCNAIAAMASNANTFYSDNTGGCAATNNSQFTTISQIFQAIANNLTAARLIPNGT